jgi:hypothetical protein
LESPERDAIASFCYVPAAVWVHNDPLERDLGAQSAVGFVGL